MTNKQKATEVVQALGKNSKIPFKRTLKDRLTLQPAWIREKEMERLMTRVRAGGHNCTSVSFGGLATFYRCCRSRMAIFYHFTPPVTEGFRWGYGLTTVVCRVCGYYKAKDGDYNVSLKPPRRFYPRNDDE